jgi:Chaperone for flagella basal body P-ring formation
MTSATPTRQARKSPRRAAATCVGLLLGLGLLAVGVASAQSSVQSANRPLGGGSATQRETLSAQGWVLREIHWDPILQHAWEVFADPVHPERPTVAVLAGGAEQQVARGAAEARSRAVEAAVPVVRVGDRVVLWSAEKNLRLQLAAVAEENGAIGDHIRLSIPGTAWDNGPGSQQPVRGVVRGAADVEMEP